MFEFSLKERDRRWNTVREAMKKRNLAALVIWGSFGADNNHNANLRYLTNVQTEGYLVFPVEGEPTLVVYLGRRGGTWVSDWRGGHPAYSRIIAERLRELHLETSGMGLVGLSGYFGEMGFPCRPYMSLVNYFPGAHFEDATDIVEKTRMIKSDEEIHCIELGCEAANKVAQAVVDTARDGIKDSEIITKMRATLSENGCDPDGLLHYYSGKEISHAGQGVYLRLGRVEPLESGDIILTEFDARYLGYKAQHNLAFSLGRPGKEWRQIIGVAAESFHRGVEALKPGISSGDLDEIFLLPVKKAGYTYRYPAFHGIGLALEEPMSSFPVQPEYKPDTSLQIEAGMVIEFQPHVLTPDGKKGLSLGCPVLVTETGCRLLNKGWKPEFLIA